MTHAVGLLPTNRYLSVLEREYRFVYIDPSTCSVVLVSTYAIASLDVYRMYVCYTVYCYCTAVIIHYHSLASEASSLDDGVRSYMDSSGKVL
jgi:hypothetical protein